MQKEYNWNDQQLIIAEQTLIILKKNASLTNKDKQLMKQLELKYEDIDNSSFGFDDVSLDGFKQDLIQFVNLNSGIANYPIPVYSGQLGVDEDGDDLSYSKKGVILLLQNNSNNSKFVVFVGFDEVVHYSHFAVGNTLQVLKNIATEYPKVKFVPQDKQVSQDTIEQYIKIIQIAIDNIDQRSQAQIKLKNQTNSRMSFAPQLGDYKDYSLLAIFIVS